MKISPRTCDFCTATAYQMGLCHHHLGYTRRLDGKAFIDKSPRPSNDLLIHDGIIQPVSEWSRECGVSENVIRERLKAGKPSWQALESNSARYERLREERAAAAARAKLSAGRSPSRSAPKSTPDQDGLSAP